MIGNIRGNIEKVASHKQGVVAIAVAAAAIGAVDVTWPVAGISTAYIVGQTVLKTWSE